jgi:hypothetical protein
MAQWEYIVIIYDTASGAGYQFGKVRYPNNYKDQDVNQILTYFGQSGWEVVASHESSDMRAVLTLRHQKA